MENVRCRVIYYYFKLFLKCMVFSEWTFKLLVLTVNPCIVAKYAIPLPSGNLYKVAVYLFGRAGMMRGARQWETAWAIARHSNLEAGREKNFKDGDVIEIKAKVLWMKRWVALSLLLSLSLSQLVNELNEYFATKYKNDRSLQLP